MSAATLRQVRDTLMWAARDGRYRPHRDEVPLYVARARQLHKQLLALNRH